METHPPLPVSRPTDALMIQPSRASKNRAEALLMRRVIGEVAADVKPSSKPADQ